jgi:hypothetical protein
MSGGIVASATFVVVLSISGVLSARDALSETAGKSEDERRERQQIRVAASGPAAVTIAPVTGISGTAIPLNLKAPFEGLRFVLFEDIPLGVKFSHGFRLKNSWIASIRDIDNLQIITPSGFAGSLSVAVLFQRDNQGQPVARGIIVIEVKPIDTLAAVKTTAVQEQPTAAIANAPQPQNAAPPPPSPVPAVPAEEEKEELARGAKLTRMGDIATARLIYQNLALRGSANGARALAETYDPAYLKDVAIAGLRPDIEAAKKWYRRAADLGDSKAATRLTVLDQR